MWNEWDGTKLSETMRTSEREEREVSTMKEREGESNREVEI